MLLYFSAANLDPLVTPSTNLIQSSADAWAEAYNMAQTNLTRSHPNDHYTYMPVGDNCCSNQFVFQQFSSPQLAPQNLHLNQTNVLMQPVHHLQSLGLAAETPATTGLLVKGEITAGTSYFVFAGIKCTVNQQQCIQV